MQSVGTGTDRRAIALCALVILDNMIMEGKYQSRMITLSTEVLMILSHMLLKKN
jgi:hypothetical protein